MSLNRDGGGNRSNARAKPLQISSRCNRSSLCLVPWLQSIHSDNCKGSVIQKGDKIQEENMLEHGSAEAGGKEILLQPVDDATLVHDSQISESTTPGKATESQEKELNMCKDDAHLHSFASKTTDAGTNMTVERDDAHLHSFASKATDAGTNVTVEHEDALLHSFASKATDVDANAAVEQTIGIGTSQPVITTDSGIHINKVREARVFNEWCNSIAEEASIEIQRLRIQSFDVMDQGSPFIQFEADATIKGRKVSGIVSARGGSVAILVVLTYEDTKFALVVRQPHVATGTSEFAEIPFGTIDKDGNFAGEVAQELKDRARIEIHQDDLIDITALTYKGRYAGVFSSPAGSYDFTEIFLHQQRINADEFENLNRFSNSNRDDLTTMKLHLIPLHSLWRTCPDAKTLAAICLYEKWGLLR